MNMTDALASLILLVVAAAALMYVCERTFPSDKSAADLGYMPGSEAPEGGWPIAIVLAVAVGGLLLFGPYFVVKLIGT